MRPIDADAFKTEGRELYRESGWGLQEVHYSQLDVECNINAMPTIEAEPIKMMCNGDHIKCPAHKDYERGYKDGQAEAQMKAEKHGQWVEDEYGFLICSACGNIATYVPLLGQIKTPYCNECGARMDEVEE